VETEVVDYKGDNNGDDRRLHDQIQEQTMALEALYLSSSSLNEEKMYAGDESNTKDGNLLRFVVKRGFQVLAVATYSEQNGVLTDVAIRTTGRVYDALLDAIKQHALSLNKPQVTVTVRPRTTKDKTLFQRMGFIEPQSDQNDKKELRSMMTLVL
jgi:hypothetical protein